MKFLNLILFLLLSIGCVQPEVTKQMAQPSTQDKARAAKEAPYVLLVSLDGFRYDYLNKYKPENLYKFKKKAAYANSLIPVFPSNTFPNHYSIITGQSPQNHGIVNNRFYDSDLDKSYSVGSDSVTDPTFYGGLPFWSVVNSYGLKSASYFWLGSDVKIKGRHPTYYYDYYHTRPNKERIAQVISWFKLPQSQRPRFVTLYMSTVDSAGHKYGPDSPQLKEVVHQLDASLGDLFAGLETLDLDVNVIIVSDHGMKAVHAGQVVDVSSAINAIKPFKVVGAGSQIQLYFKKADKEKLQEKANLLKVHFAQLAQKNHKKPFAKVLLRSQIPDQLNYKNSHRVGDILIQANAEAYLVTSPQDLKETKSRGDFGSHGWDPHLVKDVHGIFLAKGPNIRPLALKSFNNVHIYPFLLELMDLKTTSPYDGNASVLRPIIEK